MASELFGSLTSYRDRTPFRVLSLDGGGMRGLYTASVLARLAKRLNGNRDGLDVGAAFDLIAGTSTGAILACALASGLPPAAICELYRLKGKKIFPKALPAAETFQLPFVLAHLLQPFNDNAALQRELHAVFGDETLGQMYARRGIAVCLQTVNMSSHRPVVFKTSHLTGKMRDEDLRIVDACLASAAAPLFLPLAQIVSDGTTLPFIDGGLWANSPILVGLIEALSLCGDRPIEIVSVGTCPPPTGDHVKCNATKWGVARWKFGAGVVETAMDVQVHAHRFMLKMLRPHLNKEVVFIRFDQTAPSKQQQAKLGLDRADPAAIDVLMQLGANDGDMLHSEITENESKIAFLAKTFGGLQEALARSDAACR